VHDCAVVSAPAIEVRGGRRRGELFVAAAALAWSSVGVLQRGLSVDTPTQVAGRAAFACVALAVFVTISSQGRPIEAFRSTGRAGLAVAVCMAIASGSFIVALNHATVASVFFIQAVAPVAAALLAWFALREAITRRALVSMTAALVGVSLMVGTPGSGSALGLAAAFVMALAFSAAIIITRHRRDVSMTPAVCLSQVLLVLVFGAFAEPSTVTRQDLGLFVLLGCGQMALGLALFTAGARLIPAPEAALISLLEIVLGPLWVWIALSEQPPLLTLAGGAVIILAVLLLATQSTQSRERSRRLSAGPSSP
jgi:drug/metabolite transporter (DMT)-like permease